jgi:stearoyl-CoA desaturase (delta-9 desaturase)
MLDNVDDLWKDPICAWQHRFYLPISIVFNVGVVLLLGWATGQYLGMAIIAGLLRVVLVHHFTFTINSLAHRFGRQRWSTNNTSRDNWFISLVSFGEGYHNYHHAFQTDYRNGPTWYNYDPSKWLIWSMGLLGLAKDLRWAHADIVLRKRYEDRCAAFSHWLDEKTDRLRLEKHEVLETLQARAESAQLRLEEALDELRSARRAWADLRLEKSKLVALERKAITRAYRHRIRVVKASLREWEALIADTMALHHAALATAPAAKATA